MSKRRPFAAFDIDGTLIRWQIYHAITDSLARQGAIDQDTYQGVKKARRDWKQRLHEDSFREYESKLVRAYHTLLPQLSPADFEAAVAATVGEYKDQVYTYTRDLLKNLQKRGYLTFAISGSHHEAIAEIADYYKFDDFVGAQYIQREGSFTGDTVATIGRKHEILESLIEKHGAALKDSFAVGDSTGDISMLEMVDNPIAFNPDRGLFRTAQEKGWKIVLERKNMVYELEKTRGSYELAS